MIDGQDQVRGITAWNANIALEHLTLTRGKAPVTNPPNNYLCSSNISCGGAIFGYNSDVSLQKTVISGNQAASHGGGISAGTVAMTDTQIINNRADGRGGGIDAGKVTMLRSTVDGNSATGMGGLYALGGGVSAWEFSAVDSIITRNTAKHAGGVSATRSVIERTRIEYNTAEIGGGLWLDIYDGKIANSIISNNTASEQGGGLYAYSNVVSIAGTVISNNKAGAAGDAIYANDGLTSLRNVTIASTERAPHEAVYIKSLHSLFLFDTIITNQAVGVTRDSDSWLGGDNNAFFNNGVDYTVNGTAQTLPFEHLVTTDPRFVDPAAGDFHLRPNSPLIDAGDPKREEPNPEWINERDIDGDAVPYGPRADIGADEWVGTYQMWTPLVAK